MNTTLYKLKNKLFILIITQTQWIGAQPTPPIRYVYDTIILRDTIRIKKTKRSILVPLPMKIDVPTIESIQKTATFLPKRILGMNQSLLHPPKKRVEMKKNVFWAMLLSNLPNLMAQNHVNLSVGSGAYVLTTDTHMSNPNAHFQIGISVYRQAFDGRLNYGAGLDYHYMLGSDFFVPATIAALTWECYTPFYYVDPIQADYMQNYSTLSLPVYLQWNLKYVKPIIGIAYEYKKIPVIFRNSDYPNPFGDDNTRKYTTSTHKLAFLGGIEVPFSKIYSARLNYVHEILGNEQSFQNGYSYSTNIKNYRIDLTFVAHLSEFGCR